MSAPRPRIPATTSFIRGAISATRRAADTQWCASHMSQMTTAEREASRLGRKELFVGVIPGKARRVRGGRDRQTGRSASWTG